MHPHDENCRPSQALCTPLHENWGDVSGSAQPHDENCRPSQALCTPISRKLWDVSGCLHPQHKIADRRRLRALSVLSNHQNCGTSKALCTPMMKIADSFRLCAPPSHENCGTSQALCTLMMKSPSVSGFECSAHEKCGGVSGGLQPHDENCRPPQALRTPHEGDAVSVRIKTHQFFTLFLRVATRETL